MDDTGGGFLRYGSICIALHMREAILDIQRCGFTYMAFMEDD
jgi:hypothetical protein